MKKAMEKVLALVIALVLVCAMSAAMAEEVPAETAPVEEVVEVKAEEIVEETETVEEVVEEVAVEAETEEVVIEEVSEEELPEDAQLMSVIEDKLNAGRSVSVYVSCGDELSYGDTVELYAVLKGYEGTSYEMQWQVSLDNSSWSDISGENGSEYELTLTEDNANNYYRVAVTIDGVEI